MTQNTLLSEFDFITVGKQVLAVEQKGLAQLDQYINNNFRIACEKLLRCSGKVVMMGMGKSGHIARKLAATFASTGTPAFFVHPSEAGHGDLGMISYQDFVIALSNSGESHEILALIPLLKRKKIPMICMTSKPNSTMGKSAEVHLCVHVSEEACPFGLAPTASTTAALVMGDALAIALLKAKQFTVKDFALSHPSGVLGQKLLLHVSDIMHTGDDIPLIAHTASLHDAILEMTRKNLGMIVVCYTQSIIAGIFTDGDLRRLFAIDIDFPATCITDVMTPRGVRVTPGMLAAEALNLMQSRNITSLLVAKGDKLVGVVHMHDMLRAGVI